MSKYHCDACSQEISHAMYRNGVRLKGEALCFVCQAIRTEKESKNQKMSDLFNLRLYKEFGVTRE